jgi:hypothetical protein
MRRTGIELVIILLAGAALWFVPARAGTFAVGRGTTLGMAGLSSRTSSGSIFTEYPEFEQKFRTIDPLFRAGYGIVPGVAVGAELRMLRTFPVRGNALRDAPSFSFGPSVMLTPPELLPMVSAFFTATLGMSYGIMNLVHSNSPNGWDFGASAGILFMPRIRVGLGLEASWHYDVVRWWGWNSEEMKTVRVWRDGNTLALGLRVCGVEP